MADKAGDVKTLLQVVYQRPVADADVRHIAHHTERRVNQTWQDHRDGDQFAQLALVVFDKLRNGGEQRIFQCFLGPFRQRIVLFTERFSAHVVQGDGGIVTPEANGHGVEMPGFGDNGNGAAAAGGGLLIDFFDQPALQQLASNFSDAGGR
jgi:hypothetical protein